MITETIIPDTQVPERHIQEIGLLSNILASRIPEDLDHEDVKRMLEIQESQVNERWRQRIFNAQGVYRFPDEAGQFTDVLLMGGES